ncbi:MAG: ABC transporter substrate-binding protein [Brachymonas sp.]|nr:ABC transporter substrate-binding protein [Brachymonas sp.]
MNRRWLLAAISRTSLAGFSFLALSLPVAAQSAETPDAFIRRLSVDVLDTIKADKAIQAGDVSKIAALVNTKILPNVNFQRMTASAVGRAWRSATPEQQKRLQEEFKTLLMRTYSGALSEVKDQTIAMRPLRMTEGDTEVTVRTEIKGRGDPIALDYRVEKAGSSWRIYDINVASVWLIETYRTQFAQEINANGIDGLINKLAERNKGRKA